MVLGEHETTLNIYCTSWFNIIEQDQIGKIIELINGRFSLQVKMKFEK